MDTSPSNKREFSRSRASVRAKASTDCGVTVEGESCDVSLNGLSVATTKTLPLDMPCAVTLTLEGGAGEIRIEAKGKVARIDGETMAIEFTGLDGDSVEHLRNLILYNADNSERTEQEFHDHLGLKQPKV